MSQETLDRLQAEYSDAHAKFLAARERLKKLKGAIEVIAETFKLRYELPTADDDETIEKPTASSARVAQSFDIRNGQFYGRPHLDAAEEYLRLCPKNPKTLDDILEALKRGGAEFTGKDPRSSLGVQLVRSTMRFVRLPTGEFGLLEWYPNVQAKRTNGKRKGATSKRVDEDSVGASQSSDSYAASEADSDAGSVEGAVG